MAKIRSLKFREAFHQRHSLVDATWGIVSDSRGRLVQLSTYGSDARKSEPKVSQTIQFDERYAANLIRIFRDTFGEEILSEAASRMRCAD